MNGSCHCGAIRFEVTGRIQANAIRRYRSSGPVERSFCGECGSHFTFTFDGMPHALWVAAGALEDDPSLRPEHHMFVASKASWHEISDALPQHAEYPPFGE